jgi:ABC-type Zn uptake system ZnuABC Zn-binding protein ZnuA
MSRNPKNRSPLAAIFLATMVLLSSLIIFWPEKRPAGDIDTGAGRVGATVFPLFDIARNIAGGQVNIVLLTPPGASPHTFEPRPSDLRRLQGATVVYAIGHGLDDWVGEMAKAVEAEQVVVDRGIDVWHSAGGESGDDPHYWLDIGNAAKIAGTIADDLSTRFPGMAGQFRRNLNDYLLKLVQADDQLRSVLGSLPNNNIVTLHDAWYYFARAYRLNIVGSFEPTAGREPTPQYLAALQAAVARAQAKTLFSEPQLSTQGLESFLMDNDLNTAILDPIGGVADRDSYIKMMNYNARVIKENQQ